MAAIEVEGLCKLYRTRIKEEGLKASFRALTRPVYKEVKAVDNISFTVEQGEILAFIGPNGAGKSTTIKMLTGILHPSSGRLSVLGMDPATQRRRLSYRIGTVFGQKSQLWFHLPPMDSFVLLGAIYDIEKAVLKKRIDELAERFEIGDLLKTPVRKLSLGQRIRCEVAASLLHSPDILFLDEPTIGLDVVAKHRIRELILQMNREQGTTIFLTSHDTGDMEQLCRRAIVIDHGRIILDEPVKKLKYDYMNRKIIAVRFTGEYKLKEIDGITLEKSGRLGARLSVDTRVCSIDEAMRWLIAQGGVADITVEDPPMEDIIASIFEGGGQSLGGGR
ncbi:MAG TPA: ATP-binding cassette domain-containing protein [Candidatus Atribacteria bacterium]|nr:ATP-binding cassette domain-containing protein [Candidatus Atribacteria bacterium]HPT78427.1 ATP-binding cassette domain-containing protein [Candidatus Atribacteria bacterium]